MSTIRVILTVAVLFAFAAWAQSRPKPAPKPPATTHAFCAAWAADPPESRAAAVVVGLEGEVLDHECVARNADRLARVVERNCKLGPAWAAREMRREAERLCP